MERGKWTDERLANLERQLEKIEAQAYTRVGRLTAVEQRITAQENWAGQFRETVREDMKEIKDDLKAIRKAMDQQSDKREADRNQLLRAAWIVSFGLAMLAIGIVGILL